MVTDFAVNLRLLALAKVGLTCARQSRTDKNTLKHICRPKLVKRPVVCHC